MIYRSNNLEHLCSKLAAKTGTNDLSPFAQEIIVTQSAGMTAWVKTELAKRNGIIANISFMNQDSLMNELMGFLTGNKQENARDRIRLQVYGLLGSEGFRETFPAVASYYQNDDLRRIQLSDKISDLFDQYQLYRPEMIKLWDKELLAGDSDSDENWQQWLWKKTETISRKDMSDRMISEMKVRKKELASKYPRISLFGITVFTKFHLDFFRELADCTSLDIYLCLPSDLQGVNNDLLESFGSKARELKLLVSGTFDVQEPFEKVFCRKDTSLAKLQENILEDAAISQYPEDGSILINSCHTPGREVECLYNYLLDLFEKDKNLKPGDILVMTPDIDKYAPFIKAVFKNAPVRFPFKVSGAAKNKEDSIAAALEMIVKFTEEDFTSEKVISLLENKRIRASYSINDTDYLRSVVKNANIRFGYRNNESDDTRYVSWEYGLEKILLGYAMLTDREFPAKDGTMLFPYRDSEASESHDLLRLKAFVEKLRWIISEKEKPRNLYDWKSFLLDVTETMIWHDDFDREERADLSSVYRSLSYINNIDCLEEVPFKVFLNELDSKLFGETRELQLNTGDITVADPTPVRGIPFKIICILGLDNEVFPSGNNYMDFDLLGENYREGDRNKKETDKYLFLDTLLAAREKIWISYTGRSIKNNNEIPPSIVIDILTDHLGINNIIIKQPLHGFSSVYQKDDPRMFSYLYNETETDFGTGVNENAGNHDLTVYGFLSFFEHPAKWYFRNILGISYEEEEVTLPENELFTIDHLQRWILKNELVKSEDDLPSFMYKAMKRGVLPLKNSGKVTLDELEEEIHELKEKYREIVASRPESNIFIDLMIKGYSVRGCIDSVYEDEFIAWSFTDSSKHWITAWLKTLLLSASGRINRAVFIDKYGYKKRIDVPNENDSKTRLDQIMSWLERGSGNPLKFSIRVAEKAMNGDASPEKTMSSFRKEALGEPYIKVEQDPYLKVLYDECYFDNLTDKDIRDIMELAVLLKMNE